MPVLIGTSGWQYRDWRGVLYPQGLAERNWLAYYAERYGTQALRSWVQRTAEAWPDNADSFVYFNNDQHAAALYDAAAFASIARRAGRAVTPVPEPATQP